MPLDMAQPYKFPTLMYLLVKHFVPIFPKGDTIQTHKIIHDEIIVHTREGMLPCAMDRSPVSVLHIHLLVAEVSEHGQDATPADRFHYLGHGSRVHLTMPTKDMEGSTLSLSQ